MQGRQKEVKHMRVCATKSKNINRSPRINIGNGWKEFKTTNELKVVVTMKICNEFSHFEGY